MARAATTSDVFNAISEFRRREIISLLVGEERTVSDLVSMANDLSQPQVSKHLRVLREVGLVQVREEGRMRWYRLDAEKLKPVFDWVSVFEPFWDHQLSKIKQRAEQKTKRKS